MTIIKLLNEVKKIADAIVKVPPLGIPEKVRQFVKDTRGDIKFFLFVTKCGMSLARLDDQKQIEGLLLLVEEYEKSGTNYLLYQYDLRDLVPILTEDFLTWCASEYNI